MLNNTQEAIEANIYVHSSMVDEYNDSPHFNVENQKKVKSTLDNLIKGLPTKNLKLIDFGCGTGFIIDLVKDKFTEIRGVDVTQAMLDKVDLSSNNIYLSNCPAEDTPFLDNSFDMATAYSFMDHLVDYKALLKEGHRVLKPEGIFYIDLNPNRHFWSSLENAEKEVSFEKSELVKKEIYATIHNDERMSSLYNLDIDELKRAEPIKNDNYGFDPHEVINEATRIGFSKVEFQLHWFIGEAKIMHGESLEQAKKIEKHLTDILPLSKHLFKYIRFIFYK